MLSVIIAAFIFVAIDAIMLIKWRRDQRKRLTTQRLQRIIFESDNAPHKWH